jgi:hypothetical protein
VTPVACGRIACLLAAAGWHGSAFSIGVQQGEREREERGREGERGE